jgi:hypothetical protein
MNSHLSLPHTRKPKFRKNLWHAHGNVDLASFYNSGRWHAHGNVDLASFYFEYELKEAVGGEHEAT